MWIVESIDLKDKMCIAFNKNLELAYKKYYRITV